MIDSKLIEYIKASTSSGLTKDQIVQQLRNVGWNEKDIDDAFLNVASESAVTGGSVFGVTQTSSFLEKVLSVFKTKTFLISVSALLILLCVFAGVAYGFGIWPFGGASKYSKDELFNAMLDNIQGVNSIFYSSEISLLTQSPSPQTKPLDLSSMKFKNDGENEKLIRDAKRFSDFSSIKSALSSYLYKNAVHTYPVTLLAASITTKDPLGQAYNYQLSADKKHYTLAINFETEKAINTVKKYAVYESGKSMADDSVIISGKTVTFDEKGSSYYYMDNKIQQSIIVGMIQRVNGAASFLPGEFKGKFNFSGNTQVNEQDVADTTFQLGGDVNAGDLAMSAGAEFIKKDADYYFRINKFPNLFFDISKIKGKWVKLSPDDLQHRLYGVGVVVKPTAKQNGQVLDKIRLFFKLAKEESVFIINGSPTEENIDNQKTYHYSVSVDQEKFKAFYKKIVLEFNTKFGNESLFKNEEAVLPYLYTTEFDNLFQYFKNNAKFDIWINSKTAYPEKISFGLALIPDETSAYGVSKKNQELSLSLNLQTKNINQITETKAPKEFITFTEAQELLFPGQKDSRLKADLAQARSLSEIYADSNKGSYSGFDKDKKHGGGAGGQWETIKKDIISQGVLASNIKETYTTDAYAIQIKLTGESAWWCVDSKGASKKEVADKFITGQTTKCP